MTRTELAEKMWGAYYDRMYPRLKDYIQINPAVQPEVAMLAALAALEEECEKVEVPGELAFRSLEGFISVNMLKEAIAELRKHYFFVPKSQPKEAVHAK